MSEKLLHERVEALEEKIKNICEPEMVDLKNIKSGTISFNMGMGMEVLGISPKGKITWTIYEPVKRVIEITDQKLLALAFMDVVAKLTSIEYDYSLLDPELYEEYKRFLKSEST